MSSTPCSGGGRCVLLLRYLTTTGGHWVCVPRNQSLGLHQALVILVTLLRLSWGDCSLALFSSCGFNGDSMAFVQKHTVEHFPTNQGAQTHATCLALEDVLTHLGNFRAVSSEMDSPDRTGRIDLVLADCSIRGLTLCTSACLAFPTAACIGTAVRS